MRQLSISVNDSDIDETKMYGIEKCAYYQTFIGINDNGSATESKLYYISALYGRDVIQRAS